MRKLSNSAELILLVICLLLTIVITLLLHNPILVQIDLILKTPFDYIQNPMLTNILANICSLVNAKNIFIICLILAIIFNKHKSGIHIFFNYYAVYLFLNLFNIPGVRSTYPSHLILLTVASVGLLIHFIYAHTSFSKGLRNLLATICIIFIIIITLARLYLGVCYPLDAIAALTIGYIELFIYKKLILRK